MLTIWERLSGRDHMDHDVREFGLSAFEPT